MNNSEQYDKFLTYNNFYLAFRRLQTASRNLYKQLYYEDLKIFGFFITENINSLINEIKQEIYKPEKSYKIFIPKKDNLVRPLSLLKFKDLLIYQAIINIIADYVHDYIYPYYNNIIFGNFFTISSDHENNRIFFFKPWQKQWEKFGDKTKEYYDAGYKFLSEFDIASFFDTIDHNILRQILYNTYKIENKILDILIQCLEAWTSDFSEKTFSSKHGIPQGPLGSAFLADLYLIHLDLKIVSTKRLDIKYIRYVDDLRIFSKDRLTGEKSIAYLDLLARDLGLIPQSSKILINEITDINKLLRHQKSKFSVIVKEFKKKDGTLKSKTHRKLKKRFINCFDESSGELYLDKTIIGFSLFKLNKDEEVKNVILSNYDKIYTHFEGVLFYLRKYFSEEQNIREWLKKILRDDALLFHHLIALIFKYFPDIEFMDDIYQKYMKENHRHWLVKYYMIDWLFQNDKNELLFSFSNNNYFINRELTFFKMRISKDISFKKSYCYDLLISQDSLTSLQGIYFYPCILVPEVDDSSELNEYVRYILSKHTTDYINYILKRELSINEPENFFNRNIWDDEQIFCELNNSFSLFYKFKDIDSSKSLLNLNLFNNLIFDKICERLNITNPSKDYGVNLNSNCISHIFPFTNRYFTEINDKRNQKSEAHPYDKYGNLRVKIDFTELSELTRKEIKALEEICNYNSYEQYGQLTIAST